MRTLAASLYVEGVALPLAALMYTRVRACVRAQSDSCRTRTRFERVTEFVRPTGCPCKLLQPACSRLATAGIESAGDGR
jgi:hypothetical protein